LIAAIFDTPFPWPLFLGALFIGGLVKGALGVGLPLVSTPLLGLGLSSYQSISLLAAPVALSNLYQAIDGGRIPETLRRFGGLIIAQFIVTVLTVKLTLSLSAAQLNDLLAIALLLAVATMIWQPTLAISREREAKVGIVVGLMAGILGGVSSLTGPVTLTYLMALRLDRETFVSSISTIYFIAALPLYGALMWYERMTGVDLVLSIIGLVPMAVGLSLGKRVRYRLNEQLFRKLLLGFLAILALILLFK
jgi:uncharacterized membrane protein YfcA